MRGVLGIMATVAALLAFGGASASGAVICVPNTAVDSSCTAGQGQTSLDLALGAAQASTGARDDILLGAGTWPVSAGYDPTDSGNRLGISGAPSTHPGDVVITRASAGGVLLDFYHSDEANVDLRNLTVRASGNQQHLISSRAPLLTVDNVIFDTAVGVTGLTGIEIYTGALNLSNSSVDLGSGSDWCLTSYDTAGRVVVSATVFKHCSRGVVIFGNGFTGDRIRVSNVTQAAVSLQGGTGTLTNSLLVDNQGVPGFVELGVNDGPIDYTISHSTIVNASNSQEYGVSVFTPSGNANVRFYDTIISGPYYSAGIRCDQYGTTPAATITTDYLASDGINNHGATNDCAVSQNHSYADAPGFLNSGVDPYQLGPGSPLIDQDPAPLHAGEPALDLALNPRIRGCGRDLGAYEAVGGACPVLPPPATVAAAAAFTGSFKFSKSKVKRKKAAKVSFTLSAPATVAFSLKAKKKKNKVPKLKPAAGKAGANSYSVSTKKLKAGKYTLTATLPSGASKSASLTVTK